jgi:hypothetical protein
MKRISAVLSLFLAVAGCDNASVRERAEAARQAREAIAISPERARINGLGIGSSEAEVVAAFGRPARIDGHGFDEIEGKPARTINYDGIEIYLVGGEIFNLECRSRVCVTTDGIRVGDSAEKVLAVLGPGQRFEEDDGTEVLHYPVSGADVALILTLRDGKLIELELWFDYA